MSVNTKHSLNFLLIHLLSWLNKSSADRSQPEDFTIVIMDMLNVQCNYLFLLGAMWSPLRPLLSLLTGEHQKRIRQVATPLRWHTPVSTHAHTVLQRSLLFSRGPVPYRLLLGLLLMTVRGVGVCGVFWERHSMDVVCFFFSFVQLPLKWPTPSAFTQYIFSV